ncbi:MAG: DUF115 domain-containing protein [Treponema sp.]|nr:DUF115 domain-containing protein [Treponema sp.]
MHPVNSQELPHELAAGNGFSIGYRGKTLLSKIDPIGQSERIIQNVHTAEGTLYLCPSPLYGYGLNFLLDNLKNNSAILCIEADNLLYEFSLQKMKSLLDVKIGAKKNRIVLLKTEAGPYTAAYLCEAVKKIWGGRSFRRIEMIRLTGGWQLYPDHYNCLVTALQKDIATVWGNAMTLIKLGRLYAKNAVRNLALLPESGDISQLDYGENPVLVLGAGPGMDVMLDKIPAQLSVPQNRPFRIICADTCMTSLKERNIKPDLAVILESQFWNLRDFINTRGQKIPAAVDLSALPASTRVLDGKNYFFWTPWTKLRLFDRLQKLGLLPPGLLPLGSVGLTAVELARSIGCGPVITAGLDFAFTVDSYHARSSPGHLARLASANRFKSLLNAETAYREGTFTLQSESGENVRSDPAMRGYRDLFEAEFSGTDRIFQIKGPGLALGVKELDAADALRLLTSPHPPAAGASMAKTHTDAAGLYAGHKYLHGENKAGEKKAAISGFIKNEMQNLLKLRAFLTGQIPVLVVDLDEILDTCDYLWAHFPECAAAEGRRPPASDLGFLKRVRMEIEPFLKIWEKALIQVQELH